MSRLLVIGCGGVASVAIRKCCQNSDVFTEIMIASRTKEKCDALKEKIESTTKTKIETAKVDADNAAEVAELIRAYKPDAVLNVALPYQDLTIMDACLEAGADYIDTAIEKQDKEGRFWNLCNGGKIQYVKYPIDYNMEAVKTLIRRAMEKGFYEGVNLSLAYCDDCGHQELEMDVCPKCGSHNLTKIDRMNGYLSYSRVHGDTRLNDAKMAEIAERKSM